MPAFVFEVGDEDSPSFDIIWASRLGNRPLPSSGAETWARVWTTKDANGDLTSVRTTGESIRNRYDRINAL